jgi:hypothetical protein
LGSNVSNATLPFPGAQVKIKMEGDISSLIREEDIGGEKIVKAEIIIKGQVEGEVLAARRALLTGTLTLKPIVAEKLKLGSKLYITITDENTD